VLVLNTRNVAKFGFVTLDITRKNSLYWILNVEIYLDAMDIGIPLNIEIKHLSNMTKILWKEISQILWIYFMPMYGWLDKAIKLLMKNHEIRLICSIPRSEYSNQYYEFISCLCMVEQSNELLTSRKSWNLSKLVLLHSHKWMQQHFIYIFMIVIMIMILSLDMVIKKISNTHFVTRSGIIMWKKKEKENVKILTKRWKYILSLRW